MNVIYWRETIQLEKTQSTTTFRKYLKLPSRATTYRKRKSEFSEGEDNLKGGGSGGDLNGQL